MKLDLETTLDAIYQWCALEQKMYDKGNKQGAMECREAISRLEERVSRCEPLKRS
jgi:hypothetical protein